MGQKNYKVLRDDETHRVIIHGNYPKSPEERREWDARIKAVLLSSSQDKLRDNSRILRWYELPVRSVNADMVVEESEEAEDSFSDIVRGKDFISGAAISEMGEREAEAYCEKIGVPDRDHILRVSEDRGLFLDPRLRDHEVFQQYKNVPLVEQVFREGVPFPGHRFKELQQIMGGLGCFLNAVELARRELPEIDPEKYKDLRITHDSHIAYGFKCEAMGIDVVIEVTEKDRHFRLMTDEEKQAELESEAAFDGDHIDMPKGYEESIEDLRQDPFRTYFEEEFHGAVAWKTFCEIFGVPKRDDPLDFSPIRFTDFKEPPKVYIFGDPNNKNAPKLDERLVQAGVFADQEVCTTQADYEKLRIQAGAVVLLPHHNTECKLYNTLQLVEAFAAAADAITVKSLYDPSFAGCPIAATHKAQSALTKLANTFNRLKFSGHKASDLFEFFHREDDVRHFLTWDPQWYDGEKFTHIPAYDLIDQRKLEAITGVANWGYTVAALGTASQPHPVVIHEAEAIGYLARQHGMTLTSGGGTRNGMGGFAFGGIQAYRDGHTQGAQLGIRWNTASMKEGKLSVIPREFKLPFEEGDPDSKYCRFEGGFHYLLAQTYAERKHAIFAPAHAGIYVPGGVGSFDESMANARHNVKVALYGEGDLPGFTDSFGNNLNECIKPMFMVDSRLENGHGGKYWSNAFNKVFSSEQSHLMGIKFVDSAEEAMGAAIHHARDLGYEISEPCARNATPEALCRYFRPGETKTSLLVPHI